MIYTSPNFAHEARKLARNKLNAHFDRSMVNALIVVQQVSGTRSISLPYGQAGV